MGRREGAAESPDAAGTGSCPGQRPTTIARLLTTRDPAQIEQLADELADEVGDGRWAGRARSGLIEALVLCLTGDSVRQDPDAEDAICAALERVGVMTRKGNLIYTFRPDAELTAHDLVAVRRFRSWLPSRYRGQPACRSREIAHHHTSLDEQETPSWSTE